MDAVSELRRPIKWANKMLSHHCAVRCSERSAVASTRSQKSILVSA